MAKKMEMELLHRKMFGPNLKKKHIRNECINRECRIRIGIANSDNRKFY